jgi:hypothetical protein
MAKIKQPSQIGIATGKVGNVIVGTWKGIHFMRGLPQKSGKPATDAQLEQRARFGLTNRFMQHAAEFVSIGFEKQAVGKTPYNVAFELNATKLISGDYPDFSIDVSELVLSQGKLLSAKNMSLANDGPLKVTLTWTSSIGRKYSKASDKLLIFVFAPGIDDSHTEIKVSSRDSGSYTIELDSDFAGEEVHVFAAFVSEKGDLVSNSKYIGSTVVE